MSSISCARSSQAGTWLETTVARLTTPWHPGAAYLTRTLASQAQETGSARDVLRSLPVLASSVGSRLRRAGLPSPKEQLSAFRLALALQLSTRESCIKAIAYDLQYSTPGSFARHIRLRCGVSPLQFFARWSLVDYWNDCVAPFMKWSDDRWTTLDVMYGTITPISQRVSLVAEARPTPRLRYGSRAN